MLTKMNISNVINVWKCAGVTFLKISWHLKCVLLEMVTCMFVSWLLPSEYVDREDVPFTCGLLEPLVMDSSKSVLRRSNVQISGIRSRSLWLKLDRKTVINIHVHCEFISILCMKERDAVISSLRRLVLQLVKAARICGLFRPNWVTWRSKTWRRRFTDPGWNAWTWYKENGIWKSKWIGQERPSSGLNQDPAK